MPHSHQNNVLPTFLLLPAIALAGLLPDAQAANTIDNFALSPEQLFDATVISVSKAPEKVMDAPAAITVLTNEDIMRSGATSIPDALRLVPGVEVERVSANNWAVSVRGFSGTLDNKLLVLIDGRTVYDPLFSGVYWDIQDTVLEDIDRIEVIRGPGATLWGANAVNGVINIITKKAQDTQGNLLSATAGNQDSIVEERYGGKLGDNGFYRAYAKYTDRNDEKTLAGDSAHDGQSMDRGGFRSDWKSSGDTKDDFTLQGDIYRSGASQYRIQSIFSHTAPFSQLDIEELNASGGNVLGRWNRTLSNDSKFTVQSYVDYTSRDQLLLKDQHTTFDVDAQYELPQWNRHKFIVGGGYRYSTDELTATPLVSFTNLGERTQVFNSFIQDKITLVPKDWFLTLGSKFEHNDYTGFEAEPSARLQWHIDDSQMSWASVSRAVRTPSRLEEDLHIIQATGKFGPFLTSLDTIPNPDFNSEELIAYELGYRRQWTPKISSDIAAFYNVYHGLATYTLAVPSVFIIGSNPTRLEEPFIPENNTSAETYGVETSLNWRALDSLNLSASHSLLVMALHNTTFGTLGAEAAEKQTPKYVANLHAAWDISKNVSYDTMLYYTSAITPYSVESHTRIDMRLAWRITDGLQASLVGQDLLDPRTHEFTSPTDGHVLATDINRAVYGNLTWRF